MQIMITIPRSGSHVFAQMMKFKMIVTLQKDKTKPGDMLPTKEYTLETLSKFDLYKKYWLHLPYDEDYISFVDACDRAFLLLRDPRDIIVSQAHIVDKLPSIGLNYLLGDGRRFADLSINKRIYFLIDNIRPMLEWFNGWIKHGLTILRYEDFINNPDVLFMRLSVMGYGTIEEIKERSQYRHPYHYRKGVAGDWKNEFTKAQKKRADKKLGEIIEAWNYELCNV